MSYVQRLRSQTVSTAWMPSYIDDRATGKKEFIDEDALAPLFGGMKADEREQVLMDETEGVGVATREDIEKYPELVAAHYLDNPRDEIDA